MPIKCKPSLLAASGAFLQGKNPGCIVKRAVFLTDINTK
jgi:hypothetical protein